MPEVKSKAEDIVLEKKLAKDDEDRAKEISAAAPVTNEETEKPAAADKTKEQLLKEDK